eukprot:TRINITY_DN3866_c0_g2_i2.p1 TRINITY_DN3866_c0_g2~~TRINITY_DN3866_c0_g2_i2.p1  ORF type:complete len:1515 (+),score=591.55 TRINITY_DN3866_c0_g2_i2:104-4648(+)
MESPGMPMAVPPMPPLPPASSRTKTGDGCGGSSFGNFGARSVGLGAGNAAPESAAWKFMMGSVNKYLVGEVRYQDDHPGGAGRATDAAVETPGGDAESEHSGYTFKEVEIQRIDSFPTSPLQARQESWVNKFVRSVDDDPLEGLPVAAASLFITLALVTGLSIGLSYATSLDQNSANNVALTSCLAAFSAMYAVFFYKSMAFSVGLQRVFFIVSYTAVSLLSHTAYDEASMTALLQISMLSLVILSGDIPLSFGIVLACGVSWVFGWLVSGYTMQRAFTATLLSMLLHIGSLVFPLLAKPVEQGSTSVENFIPMVMGEGSGENDMPSPKMAKQRMVKRKPRMARNRKPSGLARRLSLRTAEDKPTSPSSPNALRRSGSSGSESSPSNASLTPTPRERRGPERSDSSFFVASLETINTRLPTVCRASVKEGADPPEKPAASVSGSGSNAGPPASKNLFGYSSDMDDSSSSQGPGSPRESSFSSAGGALNRGMGSLRFRPGQQSFRTFPRENPLGFKRPEMLGKVQKKSAEESKKDDVETMEIVKSVVQMDLEQPDDDGEDSEGVASSTGAHSVDTVSGAVIPANMKNLPATILQKLVLLFTRLSEELDTFRVQRFICACVVQVLQCERASIFLCDWKSHDIWTVSEDGNEIRVPMQGSIAGWAAINGRVLNIRDAYKDSRFNKDVDKNTGYVTRNLLVYPISRGHGYANTGEKTQNVVAVVEAINKTNGAFTAEDEGVLALLGKQAGIHLSNAQVYQQLQVEGMKTQSLLEVSKEINDLQLDLGAMVTKIMTRARQVLHVERASIFLVDDQKKELWSILTDSETAAQLDGDNVIRLPVGVGLAGHVAVTGDVLNIPDAYACDLFNPEFDRKTGFVTKAALCVPVKPHHANKVMGVIQFINKCNGDAFHEQDVELAMSFSSFVGISLNNILLYDELREGQFIREKNKELVRLRDQAKQAAEAKSNFLMAMSHEIRTPMSGVVGMCELLMNTTLTHEQKEMADTIRSCGEALMAIINDVLDYGRLEAGKLELEKRAFSLASIIEETIDVMRPKSEAKLISLLVDMDPQMPTDVVGDQYRLRQVLTNLLGNAVKFTPNGGDIWLEVQRNPDATAAGDAMTLTFSVVDTGIGIDEEAQRKLFRPFEQADAGTTRQYGGSGLGLAICKQLVESMAGEIGIRSEPGKGSCFWFTASFGIENKQAPSVADSLRGIAGGTFPDLTVLLAISHELHLRTIAKIFAVFDVHVCFVRTFADLRHYVLRPAQEGVTELLGPSGGFTSAVELGKALTALPHHVLVDEELEGLTSEGTAELRAYTSVAKDSKMSMLMSMRAKSCFDGKESFENIFTKPVKFALVASLFSEKKTAMTIKERAESNMVVSLSPRSGVQKILVAEDNATNQLLIKRQLGIFGITPTVVGNGLEAVEALMEERYGLVFMDCHMPVLDGYGAVRDIRDKEKHGAFSWKEDGEDNITVVALTADALPHTRGLCVDAGMNDYITKPLKQATLKKILDLYYYKAQPT